MIISFLSSIISWHVHFQQRAYLQRYISTRSQSFYLKSSIRKQLFISRATTIFILKAKETFVDENRSISFLDSLIFAVTVVCSRDKWSLSSATNYDSLLTVNVIRPTSIFDCPIKFRMEIKKKSARRNAIRRRTIIIESSGYAAQSHGWSLVGLKRCNFFLKINPVPRRDKSVLIKYRTVVIYFHSFHYSFAPIPFPRLSTRHGIE